MLGLSIFNPTAFSLIVTNSRKAFEGKTFEILLKASFFTHLNPFFKDVNPIQYEVKQPFLFFLTPKFSQCS